MKSITSFIFIFGLGLSGWGQQPICHETNKDNLSCEVCCNAIPPRTNVSSDSKSTSQDYEDRNNCKSLCTKKFQNNTCDSLRDKYNQEMKKLNCFGYSMSECQKKINACRKNGLNYSSTESNAQNDDNAAIDALKEILNINSANNSSTKTPIKLQNDCLNVMVNKDDSEKLSKLIESKKKEIIEQDKKISDENKELNEEIAKVKEDQAKLEAEIKQNIQKLDVEKREKLTKIAQDIQDNGKQIRKLMTETVKKKQEIERKKFSYANEILNYTKTEKEMACQKLVGAAQKCLKKAKKGEDVSKDQVCAAAKIDSNPGKGAAGATNQKKLIEYIGSKCQEEFDLTVGKMQYDHNEVLNNMNLELKELTAQINDANESLALKQKETQEVTSELDKSKSLEEENLNKQFTNFTEKLQNIQKNLKEKIAKSEKNLDELKNELDILFGNSVADDALKNSSSQFAIRSIYGSNGDTVEAMDQIKMDGLKNECSFAKSISSSTSKGTGFGKKTTAGKQN